MFGLMSSMLCKTLEVMNKVAVCWVENWVAGVFGGVGWSRKLCAGWVGVPWDGLGRCVCGKSW